MPKPADLTISERLVLQQLQLKPGQTVDELIISTGLKKWRSNMLSRLRVLTLLDLIAADEQGRYSAVETKINVAPRPLFQSRAEG